MGTDGEVEKKRKDLKDLIDRLGWSQPEAAAKIYASRNEEDDADALRKFQEKFKKDLNRSENIELLEGYMRTIFDLPDRVVKSAGLVKLVYVSTGTLDEAVEREMKKISEEIARRLSLEEQPPEQD